MSYGDDGLMSADSRQQPIETLFLDAGGVLVFPNWERISDTLHGVDVHVAPTALAAAEPRAKRELDHPKHIHATTDDGRSPTYFNLVLREAGVELSEATDTALAQLHAYHAQHNLWEVVPDDVPGALEQMRGAGLRMVVVSNANGTLHALLKRVGLDGYFDIAFDSYLEGVEKPDPRLFDLALARASASRETTVHVGDLFHIDVAGARAAGLEGWLLDVGDLYPDVDCPRFRSLPMVAAAALGRAAP